MSTNDSDTRLGILAVERNADGRFEVFFIDVRNGPKKGVNHAWQKAGGGWAGPELLDATSQAVCAHVNQSGSIEAFFLRPDGSLWHKAQLQSGGWGDSTKLDEGVVNGCVAMDSAGRLEFFSVGSDHSLWHQRQNAPGGAWEGSSKLGDGVKTVSAARNGNGSIELFMVGADNGLWHQSQISSDQWSARVKLDDNVVLCASMINLDSRIEVFTIGGDTNLWRTSQLPGGGWSTEKLSDNVAAVTATRNADGRIELFSGSSLNVTGAHQWQLAPGGGFSAPEVFPGQGGIARAHINSDGRLEVFYVDQTVSPQLPVRVDHRYQLQAGGDWSPLYPLR